MDNPQMRNFREIQKELLYTDKILTPLKRFFERIVFDNVVPQLSENNITQILTTILNLVGTEIEGEEISFGLIITDGTKLSQLFQKATAINRSLKDKGKICFGSESQNYESIRKAVTYMKSNLLGWTPGYYEQPVIICNMKDLKIRHIMVLPTVTEKSHTPHEAYKNLTKGCNCIGIWVKPAGAVRLYAKKCLLGQMMRLRDAGGWAIRNINDIYECLKTFSGETFLSDDRNLAIDYFIYPAIAMSEERKGASIYIVPREKWEEDIRRDKNKRKLIEEGPHVFSANINIRNIKETEFMTYLKQDGCIVLSNEGKLMAVGNYFKGPGGRKRIADHVCKKWDARAIVISHDGVIRFYSKQIPVDISHAEENGRHKYRYLRLDFMDMSASMLVNPVIR